MQSYITNLNTVVGRMARGFTLSYVPADRAYYLMSPTEGLPEARVSELAVEQLVKEGMLLDPDTPDEQGVIEFDFISTVKCLRCGDRILAGDVPKDVPPMCADCEPYARCNSFDEFKKWLEGTGWDSVDAFEKDTGVSFEDEMQGKWFTVTHNRVFVD